MFSHEKAVWKQVIKAFVAIQAHNYAIQSIWYRLNKVSEYITG